MLRFLSTISRYLKMYQIVLLYQNLYNIKVLITISTTAQKITQKHVPHSVADTMEPQCLSINHNSPPLCSIVINHIHRITNKTFVQ